MSGSFRVHHLNCAHFRTMSLNGRRLICHVLLVETPADGLVLVDSGLGSADYAAISSRLGKAFAYGFARPVVDPSLAAVEQVKALGFDPKEVRHVVLTHLDLDHVGGLSDFPWATVHVHATELDTAMTRKTMSARGRYRPPMWAHKPHFQSYSAEGEKWFGFEAVRQLAGLPEEILLVPLIGHSTGHCGVAVESDQGWLLHAGDAYFDPREVHQAKRQCAPGVALFQTLTMTDRKQRMHNQTRLRRLIAQHPDISVFSAHDPGGMPQSQTGRVMPPPA
jgi:glyoxylase-like metal-dependent hydrolase (beta-lactamase superfamily II)